MTTWALRMFAALAVVGLALSAAVHVSTFFGLDPQDVRPPVWLLHLGLFVVFVPAIIAARTNRNGSRRLRDAFPHAPRWMAPLTGCLFAYAVVNFALFIVLMRHGGPSRGENGEFALTEHGRLIRKISEEEFHRYRAYEARGFSGHWMAFYSLSAAMLVSAARRADNRALQGDAGGPNA